MGKGFDTTDFLTAWNVKFVFYFIHLNKVYLDFFKLLSIEKDSS